MKVRRRIRLLVEDHHSVPTCLEKYTHKQKEREGGRERGEEAKGEGGRKRVGGGGEERLIGLTQVKSDKVDELRGQ